MDTDRRSFLKTLGAGACASVAPNLLAAKRDDLPNIVLCMADDQGWGDMAYNGHPVLKTPNFDAMAVEALRFDHFYAAAPVCSPTRGSVMTGRHPNRFGCFRWGHSLRPQETSVAEAMKSVGYVTGHFGKWHLGTVYKDSPVSPGGAGFDEWLSAPNFYDNDAVMSREGTAVKMKGESSAIAVDAAIDFIRKHARSDQPFLAVVWFGSPHGPHRAIAEDHALYANPSGKKNPAANFLGEITGMDRAFGKLRGEIKKLGVRDNTILWYCSDNGGLPRLGATGGRANKGSVYEGGLRVPAILEWPARFKGHRVTDVPCNTIDIYPTLVDIVGARVKNQPVLDGVSLTPLLDGKMKKRSKPMGFWDYPAGGISTASAKLMPDLLKLQAEGKEITNPKVLRHDAAEIKKQYPEDAFPGHSAWLDWPWKLHRIQDKKGKLKWELYDLASDAMEKANLLESEPKRVKSMTADLEKWLRSVVRSLNGKDYK